MAMAQINCKEIVTPMNSITYVDQDESCKPINITKYQGTYFVAILCVCKVLLTSYD